MCVKLLFDQNLSRTGNSSVKAAAELLIKHQKQILNIISEDEIGIIEIK